jgi:phosphoglycerate dehydrogenase-like enzyme
MLADLPAELEVADGDHDAVLEVAADSDALLTTYFAMDADAIARLRNCRIIARYGIGVDNVDLDTAHDAGIAVTNVPDYCVDEVASHAMARLSGLTVGIVGYGRIGRRVADMLAPFAWGLRRSPTSPSPMTAHGSGSRRSASTSHPRSCCPGCPAWSRASRSSG